MTKHPADRDAALAASNALFLLFRIGDERYALEAMEIAEVLPRLPLRAIAHAPHWVAGVFPHRGQVVPVIDVSALTFGHPAKVRTSTRLVLVHYRPDAERAEQLLGLVLEQATDTLRCPRSDFKAYGLDNRQAPYLGPVRETDSGLLQWIRVQELLTDPVRELLYPIEPWDLAALEESP